MRSSNRVAAYTAPASKSAGAQWPLADLAHYVGRGVGTHGQMPSNDEPDDTERERLEREREIQQARTAGYDAGRLEGERIANGRLRTAVIAAEAALEAMRSNEAKWQGAVQDNIAALAVAVARHILGRELQADVTVVADLVKRALTEFPIDQPLRIRVHPSDLSLLTTAVDPAGAPISIAPNRDVRWFADPNIQPGGCMVEGREHIIDGRVDTALERLYRQLSDNNA